MLVAEPEEEILFVYEHQHPNSASAGGGKNGNGNGEENLPLVQLKTMPDTIKVLMHSYAQLRGKQYNDRLVLSPHYTRQIVSMVKLTTRFHEFSEHESTNFFYLPNTYYVNMLKTEKKNVLFDQ